MQIESSYSSESDRLKAFWKLNIMNLDIDGFTFVKEINLQEAFHKMALEQKDEKIIDYSDKIKRLDF